jgi:hypothetical protein
LRSNFNWLCDFDIWVNSMQSNNTFMNKLLVCHPLKIEEKMNLQMMNQIL